MLASCIRACDSVDRGARITALRKPDAGPRHTRRTTAFSDDYHVCAALYWGGVGGGHRRWTALHAESHKGLSPGLFPSSL